jgi:galactofuranosylgalactofuranosylrhamnosyl-N-acetylglucosaminyl-diphospho-decaprenol beta-1,5/1,6-galactofuranosyltransferase
MITLQNIVFPDPEICTEIDLYVRLNDLVGLDRPSGVLQFCAGGVADFGTYFNAFSVGKWHKACELENLWLEMTGTGQLELQVYHALPDQSWNIQQCQIIQLSGDGPQETDLSRYSATSPKGMIYFRLKALSEATLRKARFTTKREIADLPRLAVSITTFKRETAVQNTVSRLQNFLQDYDYKDNIHVIVVDNGKSAQIAESENISYLPNANLGGAGGFARGLQTAIARDFSHVLFTDDDAAFLMESLHRTFMFLALATDSQTTVAGAMINNTHKWAMWENGAWFDRKCHPLYSHLDLRNLGALAHMEFTSERDEYENLYGGWWFFAFPVEHAKFHPYPFFVRGDDVSFSIANDFKITLLNGVVSFQDGFIEKENPQTWYLDLRSHMAHHLSLESMEIGSTGVAKIAIMFLLRNLVKFQYDTMETCLLAWEDVMKGPNFFLDNKDMAERRGRIKNLVKNELWRAVNASKLEETTNPHRFIPKWRMLVYKFSLNGHLLPFVGLSSDTSVVAPQDRGNLHVIWGAKEIVYLNADRDKAYTTKRSAVRGLGLMWRAAKMFVRFRRAYPKLVKQYRETYPKIASQEYWKEVYKDV